MNMRALVPLAIYVCWLTCVSSQGPAIDLSTVALPPGFSISLYSSSALPSARALALSGASKPQGPVITYVSTNDRGGGKVYALIDRTGQGTADTVVTLLSGLDTPSGIAWHQGSLYLSHFVGSELDGNGGGTGGTAAISKLANVDSYALQGKPFAGTLELLTDHLPAERSHALHYLRMHPNGKQLYVPQGTPCNICVPDKLPGVVQLCSLATFDIATRQLQEYATGIRNTVGFDWHPDTGVLHFTDNGRDQMSLDGGDPNDRPDCELNAAPKPGLFFGYPYCQAKGQGDPYLRDPGSSSASFWNDPDVNLNGAVVNCSAPSSHTRPVQPLGPHVAPLGMRFYRRNSTAAPAFPASYDRAIIIALHGSWNRDLLNGYKVVTVRLDVSGKAVSYQPLASFLQNEGQPNNAFTGRPVDVQQLPDGSMLISDDSVGAVYRLAYRPPSGSTGGDAPAVTAQSGAAEQGNAASQVPASGASSAGGGADVLNTALRLAVAALLAAAVVLA